uniref:AAA family ATPase n=1 Tax=Orrella sp. TaxID=1921583 RepID=UPI0040554987
MLNSTPPSPRDYAYADTVPMGTPAILAGLGGTAKTTLVMQLAVHGALSKYLGTMQVSNFSSMLFLGEENTEERDRRFGAICKGLSPNERKTVSECVVCYPAAGEDVRLNSYVYQNIEETYLANRIISLAKEHEARCGLRVGLIVFDHARLVMSGDPNDANHVTQLTRILTKIARETGSSVLVLAHSPKSVYGKEQSSDASEVFGSSAFVDNMRSAFVLHTMRVQEAKQFGIVEKDRSDYVCLSTVKSNYGRTGSYWWFKKEYHPDWQAVTLVPQQLYNQALFGQHDTLSKKILDKIKCEPGKYSPRAFRTLSGKDGEFKASEKTVQRSVDRLLDEGALLKRPPTEGEREKYGLTKNTREVFDCP